MKPLVEELEWVAPHDLFHALAADPFALFLDSATAGPEHDPALHGRWSFIAIDPFQRLVWRHGENGKPFELLKEALAALAPVETGSTTPPFPGGAAGFFGYGLGRTLEHLPPEERPFAINDQHLPDMALGFYDLVLAFDMVQSRAFIVSTGLPENKPAARLKRAETRMESMRKRISSLSRPAASIPSALPEIASNFTREGYERAVAQVIDYIHAGDIFQANLSQRFEAELGKEDTPYGLYLRLREASPAPFSSFFNFEEGVIVSSSPERFLLCRESRVETKPIKGTRKRGVTRAEDERLAAELLASEKDRAENVMIVDLLRNDISRVSVPGSVRVPALFSVETYETVHQMTSLVAADLAPGTTLSDILRALFPCGSITGAPKIRAMEILADLEPAPRDIYCGTIGWAAPDGRSEFNVAIRTLMVEGGHARLGVGGGVVYDSTADGEYEEALWKARFARALAPVPV
ncbi:MAG TPA: aminodeoxychorismate synthase component I [Rhodobiaceae bacterium]|nr:aminodeoxychorismate synthase component I [Rhodobiaceae bacterium]